jgi:phenylalanyl-tRNA synthetase beta chain
LKISLNWLKQYIDIDISPEEISDRLTMVGLEVESMEEIGKEISDFTIGEVLEVEKHPNANKLTVCKVNDGKMIHQVVCGAPNVAAGQKIVLGLAGVIIPHNQHSPQGEPFKLEKVKIRGVESQGMICSEYELGVGDDKDGILVLKNDAPIGKSFLEYLGIHDVVFEMGITPNRADALSYIGIARDLAAITNKNLKTPKIEIKESSEHIDNSASVEIIDTENCPRFCARVIKNVKIRKSPVWLQDYLKSIALRPINNIVDVTNFILMEIGQPLHAYDYDQLADNKIIVRRSKSDEKFTTLDGKEHLLSDETLMICDGKKYVGIAGVMGGLNSEISENTTNVLLEGAYFKSSSVRKTAKRLGISTDASHRFERGTDPNNIMYAIDRATSLIQQLSDGEVLKGFIDIYPKKIEKVHIDLRVSRTNFVLGTDIPKEEIIRILSQIKIDLIKDSGDTLTFATPTFRPDLEREIDLIEEVARIYGYVNIEDKLESNLKFITSEIEKDLESEIRTNLVGNGFNEIVTNSLLERKDVEIFSNNLVEVINPISLTMTALRPSIIPGSLLTVKRNLNIGERNLRLFEIGNIFSKSEQGTWIKGYSEITSLVIIMTGEAEPLTWNQKNRDVDFFDIKGETEILLKKIFLESFKLIPYPLGEYSLSIEIHGKRVGVLKEVEKGILDHFDISQKVYICEMDLTSIKDLRKKQKKYRTPTKFPSVKRDLAFIIDEGILIQELEKILHESAGGNLKKVELFDIYSGGKLAKGKKNVAFSLEFISKDHSLTSEEVNMELQKIVKCLEDKFKAVLREF